MGQRERLVNRKMKDALRGTTHQGRDGKPNHNDKISRRKYSRLAMFIKDVPSGTRFKDAEISLYKERYGGQNGHLTVQNEKYKAKRNYKRMMTIEQFYNSPRYTPVEKILQYGNKDDPDECKPDKETFENMMDEYLTQLMKWNDEHGNHIQFLDCAIHTDEASIHAHLRFTMDYVDENGVIRCDQERALEAAGIELPDPTKPKSRWNNRNEVFLEITRNMWYDVCDQFGYPVIREPLPRTIPHQDIRTFKDRTRKEIQAEEDQLEQERISFQAYKDDEMQKLEQERVESYTEVEQNRELNENLLNRRNVLHGEIRSAETKLKSINDEIAKQIKSPYFHGGGKVVKQVQQKASVVKGEGTSAKGIENP